MFAAARRTASSSTCRRRLKCRAVSTSSEPSYASPPPLTQVRQEPLADGTTTGTSTKRLFIRPTERIPSMQDAFVMVRTLEAQYGKITSFKFLRDSEVTTSYSPFFWIELENSVEFRDNEAIPVTIPDVDRSQEGGVGLEDLEGLLASPGTNSKGQVLGWKNLAGNVDTALDIEKKERTLYLRVQLPDSDGRNARQNRSRLTSSFYRNWVGFSSRPVSTSPDFETILMKDPSQYDELEASKDEAVPHKEPVPKPVHKPKVNFDFDEVVDEPVVATVAKSIVNKAEEKEPGRNISLSESIKEKQKLGKQLTKRERLLLQAAKIPLEPSPPQKTKPVSPVKQKVPSAPVKKADSRPATSEVSRTETKTKAAKVKTETKAKAVKVKTETKAKAAKVETEAKAKVETEQPVSKEEKSETKASIQDKLWKLIGGNWF